MSSDTREDIMTAAKAAVQTIGYSALSFRDLATAVGVKSSSVHYHFPTKEILAAALANRYADDAQLLLDDLAVSGKPHDVLMQHYVAAFRKALEDDNKMCLCGILSAEYAELPVTVRQGVDRFTAVNTAWLTKVLMAKRPRARKDVIEAQALAIFAAIEGAQLVARGRGDVRLFDQVIGAYLSAGLFS